MSILSRGNWRPTLISGGLSDVFNVLRFHANASRFAGGMWGVWAQQIFKAHGVNPTAVLYTVLWVRAKER